MAEIGLEPTLQPLWLIRPPAESNGNTLGLLDRGWLPISAHRHDYQL
jgi:hypothetical protein